MNELDEERHCGDVCLARITQDWAFQDGTVMSMGELASVKATTASVHNKNALEGSRERMTPQYIAIISIYQCVN